MTAEREFVAVVDDEPDLLEFYREILSETCRIETFETPQAFLDFLSQLKEASQAPKLLISDFKMPGMNGLTMIQQTRRMNYEFPFILLSGFLTKEVVLGAVGAGVFRVLEKPIDVDILVHTVDELLMEGDIQETRREIRTLTSQLREIYAGIRLIMDQYIPEDVQARMIVETVGDTVKKKISFEDLLASLEARLDHLLQKEKLFYQVRAKNPADGKGE